MDTKLVTRSLRLSNWKAIIQDRNQSGLTVAKYCEEKSISANAYYYWLRKVKESMIESNQSSFAELLPPAGREKDVADAAFEANLRINTGEMVIEVGQDTSKELLAMVLEVVTNA